MIQVTQDSMRWQVPSPGRPSMTRMIRVFRLALKGAQPFARGVPVYMNVLYRVSGMAWCVKGTKSVTPDPKSPFLFHLTAPSAAAVADMCIEALSQEGIVESGQVAAVTAMKQVADTNENWLDVELTRGFLVCTKDAPTLKHKVAKWYLDRAQSTGRPTSRKRYQAILKAIRDSEKPPSNPPIPIG